MGGYAATAGYAGGYAGGAAPSKGLAVAGGVLAIIFGAILVLGGVGMLLLGSKMTGLGSFQDMAVAVGLVLLVIGGVLITGGSMACAGKPGWTLATGIIMAVFSGLGLLGLAGGNVNGLSIVILLAEIASAVMLIMGYGQVKKLRAWKQAGGR